jgi:EmrB/QacA subfamily drug resistance transporter
MAVPHRQPCDAALVLAGPCVAPAAKAARPWILAATILGSSMIFIDGTIVNVALPILQNDFNASLAGVQWVVESYGLCLASFMLVGGALGDRYGRRRMFALGGVIFAAASALCGASQSLNQLIVARAVQGVGGALLAPNSLAIISSSFADDERGPAIGTWSGSTAILAAVGPVAGGWLIDHASWHWAFWINVPLAVITLFILFVHVSESRDPEAHGPVDWPGASLVTIGLAAIVWGLLGSGSPSADLAARAVAIAAGVVALVAFVAVERRRPSPMIPLELFRSRTFGGTNLLTVLLYSALGGALFFLPFKLIQVDHRSPTAAGAALLPFIIILFALSRWSGGLVTRYGARLPLIVGPTVAAFGFLLLALGAPRGDYGLGVFPGIAVLGLGMAVSVAPLTTAVMGAVPGRFAGTASGINNTASRVASVLAIAVLGVVLLVTFQRDLERRASSIPIPTPARQELQRERVKLAAMTIPREIQGEPRVALQRAIVGAFLTGYRIVLLIAAALALSSAFVSWRLIGPDLARR